MRKIAVIVEMGLQGCRRQGTFEVDDDSTDDEIEEIARDAMFEMITWTCTEAAKRYQRRGVAIRLWHHGIARWRPISRINAIIGTPEGMSFLARMTAELEYSNPGVFLHVKVEPSDHDSWTCQKEWAARHKLRELGKVAARAPKTKRIAAAPTLQLAAKAAG